jgi:hypothetical protein
VPGAARDSCLLRLATVASSHHPVPAGGESFEGGRRGSAKGADSGSPHGHAANAFSSFVSTYASMSGSVEGFLQKAHGEELPHIPVAAPHTPTAAGHGGTRGDHALVPVNAAPAGKRGSGGVPGGGGGVARGGVPAAGWGTSLVHEHANVENRHRGELRHPHPPPPTSAHLFPSTPSAHPESERPEKMLCQRAEGSGAHVRARPEMQRKARSGQVCFEK